MKMYHFGAAHFLLLLLLPICFCLIYFLLKNKPKQMQQKVLFWVAIANVCLLVVHKIVSYVTVTGHVNELLPFELCNICSFLLPVAYKSRSTLLSRILFLLAVPAGLLAVLFPSAVYNAKSILNPDLWMFFVVHVLQIVLALMPICFAHTRIKIFDAAWSAGALLLYAGVAHGFNCIMRATGAISSSNIMYTFGQKGNGVVEFVYNLIPIPFVWMMPALLLVIALLFVETLIFHKCYKTYDKKHQKGDTNA